jgi:mutator protein MutT
MIECINLYGEKKLVPESSVVFRPTAYGIFIKDGKILLMNTRSSGKFSLPGGGVDDGETLEQGLQREVREEVGIEATVGDLLFFCQDYFYYDPTGEAWDVYIYFYLCSTDDYTFLNNQDIEDDEAESPQWVALKDLNDQNFQSPHWGIIEIIKDLDK